MLSFLSLKQIPLAFNVDVEGTGATLDSKVQQINHSDGYFTYITEDFQSIIFVLKRNKPISVQGDRIKTAEAVRKHTVIESHGCVLLNHLVSMTGVTELTHPFDIPERSITIFTSLTAPC